MGSFVKKIEEKCPECGTVINDKSGDYCAECGNFIIPEPKLSPWTALWLILALIFFLPIGLIGLAWTYYDLQKKKEAWRQERIITALNS